ncbi:transcription factor TGAL7-like [Miscanthus floridulus]|uniref:transcription factor TGAL7-like n=1 Tax=Miscanthus floridulus TaxID=154761 RepID=UPI00345AEDBF
MQEQGGQQRSVAAPAGPVVPLPNNNLAKDNRNSLTKKEENSGGKGAASGGAQERVKDPKTLRRLAQNREAARKSRLRKKAYIQQLETSRIRLSQLEQQVQVARVQGVFLGTGDQPGFPSAPSPEGRSIQFQATSAIPKVLNLSHNNFTDVIPQEIGQLKPLTTLNISFNMLSGEIPQQLCSLSTSA